MTALLGQAAAAQTTSSPVPVTSTPATPTAPYSEAATSPEVAADPEAETDPAATSPEAAPASKPAAAKPNPAKSSDRTESTTGGKHHGRPRINGPARSITTTGTEGVALTFDDGPDPTYTPQLLEMLAKERVKATFCVVGTNAKKHPELIREIVKAGHSLCNHSWNHDLKLGKKPPKKIKADLERTNAAIRAAVPNAKISFMRAPGGNFTPNLVKVSGKLGMAPLYWQVDPRDWDQPKGESHADHRKKIVKIVQKRTRKGSVILSHDNAQPDTIEAYKTLLPWLRRHFTLVAL
ncbi:peptidoglycan/xylan/chitin deacetylase (PgdA/CDA1 family) [Actinoplanes lutulentus]|nr:polysaccharide deacetylase family protein [Actinoplanes lutulentus]MBB2945607.1 peptidoglycan/xylan/chitin deacetylase (PgdA/CDA1 family) [Actinoplanes lutulentus]